MDTIPEKKKRGLGAMSAERRSEISRLGGLAQSQNKHRWTREEASEAGKKSGASKRRKAA